VVNEAFARLKKSKKDILLFGDEYETDVALEDGLDINDNEKLEMVNEAFKLMPANEGLVLRLFYLEEESIKEVSTITGWTESNIKVLLHRARKRMLAIIQQKKIRI
jgi:RNA polymerase sigma factor (sigma-70 family)